MSGSGGREVGAVVEEMKDEDPVAAEKLVDWLTECEKAKGKEVLKFSITKFEASGRTGMHGDAD
jgi:type II secretory pathway component PulM